MRAPLPALLVALVLLVPPAPAQERAPRPNLVLVTIDTLRREHLGCYGYPRPTSPRIDALAEEAVLFERAFATMATTFPSHLSMLTGLYPHQHGHTSNRGAVTAPFAPEEGRRSLAEALTAAGYRTGAFVSSVVLNERTGIDAGFATYDGPRVSEGKRSAEATLERALAWLADVPAEAPFFLWIHLWDVHEPNQPDEARLALLAPDETLRAWLTGRKLDLTALAAAYRDDEDVGTRFFERPKRKRSAAERKNPPKYLRPNDMRPKKRAPTVIDTDTLEGLYARYDACVRTVDDATGRLIDALAARGAWPATAFVFTADHGQSLGDNVFFGHGRNTQVNSAVPLLIRFPSSSGIAPGRSRALVSLVDLLPTLLAHADPGGLEEFRRQLVGADVLAPGFDRERVLTAEATEFHRGGVRPFTCAVLSGRWKYVHAEGASPSLYDLEAPNGEGHDVASDHPEVAQELERLLAAELASSVLGEEPADPAGAPGTEMDEELLQQLEQLGYGGGDEED